MVGETPQVERLRAAPILVAASAVQLAGVVVFLANVTAPHVPPVFGWVCAMASTGVAALACRRAAGTPGVGLVARRLWREVALVAALVMVALGGDAWSSLVDPHGFEGLNHDMFATVVYVVAMVVLLGALLRLPVGRRGEKERI